MVMIHHGGTKQTKTHRMNSNQAVIISASPVSFFVFEISKIKKPVLGKPGFAFFEISKINYIPREMVQLGCEANAQSKCAIQVAAEVATKNNSRIRRTG